MIKIRLVKRLQVNEPNHKVEEIYANRSLYRDEEFHHPPILKGELELREGNTFFVDCVVQKRDGTFVVYNDVLISCYDQSEIIKLQKKLLKSGWKNDRTSK